MVIIIFIIQLLVTFPIYEISSSSEIVSGSFVLINFFIVMFYIVHNYKGKLAGILLVSFFVRLLLMFIDLYSDINIIHSGADSEVFNMFASLNVKLGKIEYRITNYSTLLTFIYYLSDSQRIVSQYFNIVLSISTLCYFSHILKICNVGKKSIVKYVFILGFFPTYVILSSLLLRESFIIFFTTLSLFYFIKWYRFDGLVNMSCAFIFLFISSLMHSGMILVAVGYVIAFSIWNPKQKRKELSLRSLFVISLAMCFIALVFLLPQIFLEKFSKLETDDITSSLATTTGNAGSEYLSWINPESLSQMILFSPLKFIYFLLSPMLWSIRGFGDILSILVDSSIYYYFVFLTISKRRFIKKNLLSFVIYISFISVTLAYAWGTTTAGTAMRHRVKILVLLLLLKAIIDKVENIQYNNEKIIK